MFRAALRLQGIAPTDPAVAEMDRAYIAGGRIHEMQRRLQESAIPQVQTMTARWRLTVILTAGKIQLAFRSAQERAQLYPRHALDMPYWRVRIITEECKRSPHNWLDGFAARWDDEVWKVLSPPFGWECSCMIQPQSLDCLPSGLEPLQPSLQRVPKDVLNACVRWMVRAPKYLWDPSTFPMRPYVPAERWQMDPSRTSSEGDKALLRRYGISVELTHSSSR